MRGRNGGIGQSEYKVIPMNKKEEYAQKLQAQLDEWSAEIDQLVAKADKAKADARVHYLREAEQIRGKEIEARAKLEGLKGASEAAWEDMKVGAEKARDTLSQAIQSARTRFE